MSLRVIRPPITTVSPSRAITVVSTICWLNTGAWMPLPRLSSVGDTLDTDGVTRIVTLPSGLIFGTTLRITPTSR